MAKARWDWLDFTHPQVQLHCLGNPIADWPPDGIHYISFSPEYQFYHPEITVRMAYETIEEAEIAARLWAALPAWAGQCCYWCRLFLNVPHVPRVNIYRGENNLIIPTTIYWGPCPPFPPWP